jgi:hypothetical protein
MPATISPQRASKSSRRSRYALALSAAAVAGIVSPAQAVDKHWNVGTALWGNSAAWSPTGAPGTSDIVYVDRAGGGTASVNQPQLAPISVNILNGNAVRVIIGDGVIGGGFGPEASDGQLAAGGDIIVGMSGTSGGLSMSGGGPFTPFDGTISAGASMRLGLDGGIGTASQSSGTTTVGQYLRVADSNAGGSNGIGTYNLSGGALSATNFHLGYGKRPGTAGNFTNMLGTFNLSGGVFTTGAGGVDVQFGGGGSTGVFNQTGGTFITTFRLIDMARSEGSGGTAVWNYSGGSVNIQGLVFSNANGTVNYLNGANLALGQVQMAAGQILLASGHNKTLRIPAGLIVSGTTWKVDVNDNSAVLGTIFGGDTIRSAIARGYNGGAWTGTGLTSTAAKNDATHNTGLGYGLASEVLQPVGGVYTFHGQTVASNSIIVKYTYYGDADLDGDADGVDIGTWAVNFTGELGGKGSSGWIQGDWDYDGDVDGVDAGLWAQAFTGELGGSGLGSLVVNDPAIAPGAAAILRGMGITVVPEPVNGLLTISALAAATICRRRFKR